MNGDDDFAHANILSPKCLVVAITGKVTLKEVDIRCQSVTLID